jgi:opacity protein-like surface antigen
VKRRRCRLRPASPNLSSVMTPRILALAALCAVAVPARAQIIKVPAPDQAARPIAVSATFGFLQTQSRFDGQSGVLWSLGEALQYRATLELGLRSGSLGVAGSLASVPIRRQGGTAPLNSNGDIQLRQLLGTFRTPETEGGHQIIEVGLGVSQWTDYSGTDQLTADEAKARNAFTLVVGYGFGFTVGDRASLILVQDVSTLWGSKEGLPSGASRMVRQYTTRVGLRYRMRGRR